MQKNAPKKGPKKTQGYGFTGEILFFSIFTKFFFFTKIFFFDFLKIKFYKNFFLKFPSGSIVFFIFLIFFKKTRFYKNHFLTKKLFFSGGVLWGPPFLKNFHQKNRSEKIFGRTFVCGGFFFKKINFP